MMVPSFLAVRSSLNVKVSDLVGTSYQSEPSENATFRAISVVPLAEQAIPATLVSGERLKSLTLEEAWPSTYDACATAAYSNGGHSSSNSSQTAAAMSGLSSVE